MRSATLIAIFLVYVGAKQSCVKYKAFNKAIDTCSGDMDSDEPCFRQCVQKNSGYYDDNGKYDMDKIKDVVNKNINDEEYAKVTIATMKHCSEQSSDKDGDCDRAQKWHECLRDNETLQNTIKKKVCRDVHRPYMLSKTSP